MIRGFRNSGIPYVTQLLDQRVSGLSGLGSISYTCQEDEKDGEKENCQWYETNRETSPWTRSWGRE